MLPTLAASLFAVAASLALADDTLKESPKQTTVRTLAESLGAATVKGDYAKVIDHTWDGTIAHMGGREKAIKNMEAGMKKVADKGWRIKSYKVRSVGAFHKEGDLTFCVVPTTLEVATAGSRIISKNYLLGISKDDGATWKFVDSAGIQDEASRKAVLPPLPSSLVLPKREKPEVIKEPSDGASARKD